MLDGIPVSFTDPGSSSFVEDCRKFSTYHHDESTPMNRLKKRTAIVAVSAITLVGGTFAGGLTPAVAAGEPPATACERIGEIEENIQERIGRVEARMARIETRIDVLNEKLADRPVRLEKKMAKAEMRMERAQGQFDRLHARWDRVATKCGVPAAAEPVPTEEDPLQQGTLEEPLKTAELEL